MKEVKFLIRHKSLYVLVFLFLVIALVDVLRLDSVVYKGVCELAAGLLGGGCTDYYDIPIWNVYLSVGIIAMLYHVQDEIKTSNRHLEGQKRQ